MIYTRPGQALTVALRYWHLSNAALGYANPSSNTVQRQATGAFKATNGWPWLEIDPPDSLFRSKSSTFPRS